MKKTSFSSWQCKLFMVAALSSFSMFAPQYMAGTGYGVAYAQQNTTVKGVVKDAAGEPIIGASVVVKGSSVGTVTNFDGQFELTTKPNQVLVISYIGYSTQEVKATANVNVVLQEDAAALDEVVVLGYGVAQKKQDLSASVGVVSDPQRLSVRPVTTTEAMLQGQLPGVTVTANGGDPTSTPSIVIRGKGSNHDGLLWVVDGIPGAPIPSLYDIESLVVLKDAASAAIYGASSGAGGVILVTTKQAKKTNGAQVTYEGTVGLRNSVNLIHGLSAEEQIQMRNISYGAANMGNWIPENASADFKNYIGTQRTDWTDAIFRTAAYQRHNVTLAAGNEASQHRLSFAYDNDQGTLVNTYKKKMNLRYNGNYNINKYINISENLTWTNGNSRSVDTNSAYTGTVLSAIYMPQSATVYDQNGKFGGTIAEEYVQYAALHGDAVNPMRMLKANNIFDRNSSVWSTTNLTLHDIIPGLKFISRFTYRLDNSYYKSFSPIRDEIGKPNLDNTLNESSSRWTEWKTENTLTYDNTFGKHSISALVATTADQSSGHRMYMTGNNFGDESDYLQYLAFAGSLSSYGDSPNGNDIADSNVAFISRIGYSYDDRYFLTGTFRRDWAGRLPKGHQTGNFPGVTAAWKISNESFFEPIKSTLNLLKLRGSWGRMGNINSISRGYKNAVLSTSVWNEQAFYGAEAGSMYGTFIFNDRALNPFLTWETSEQWGIGLDMAMFNNRLTVALDYFNKRTYDLIQNATTGWPNTIGVSPMQVNQGEVKNHGIEVALGWSDKIGKNASYYLNGNFAWLHNEVSSTGIVQEDGTPGVWSGGGDWRSLPWCYQTIAGGPFDQFYIVKTNGIIKTEADLAEAKKAQPNAQLGDIWFVDHNEDGKIDEKDRQYCGNAAPNYTFSLQGGFNWKNLSVSAMLQGVLGAQTYYAGKCVVLSDVEGNFNRSKEILDAWSTSNPDSNIPRLSKTDPNGNWNTASDYFLENSSYLRLKNITVGYDFTDLLRKCTHFGQRGSTLTAFLSGENLFTITKYSGMDPECGGYDTLKYPMTRTISFGVKITY